jgi:hypothetical protein
MVGKFSELRFQKLPFLSNISYVAPLWKKVEGLIEGNVSMIYA